MLVEIGIATQMIRMISIFIRRDLVNPGEMIIRGIYVKMSKKNGFTLPQYLFLASSSPDLRFLSSIL